MNRRLRIIGTLGEMYLTTNGFPITSEYWDKFVNRIDRSPKRLEFYLQEQYYSGDDFKEWETIAQFISGYVDTCPKCGGEVETDHNSKQCHHCQMLWPKVELKR